MGEPPRRRFDVDQWVAAGSAVGLVAVGILLALDPHGAGLRRPRGEEIARLGHVDGAVRWRSAGTLVWETAGPAQPLVAGDAVFVQPGGGASLDFRAGATVELDDRTLVVVEPPDEETERVRVLAGSVVAAAGAGVLAVASGTGDARIEPGGAVAVAIDEGLRLLEGRAELMGRAVGTAPPAVALRSPERSHRIYARDFPISVALRWDGEAARDGTLEVSRERSFGTLVSSGPGAAGFFEVSVDAAGPWYWRITDGRGGAASEVRKFMAIADRPPRPFSPARGEIVLAPQGVQVPFWWTAVAGASRYRVEVAPDAGFQRIAFSEPATGPGLWAPLDLPEGAYYWRVRAERGGDGDRPSPASAPVGFRLIRRPVLDAPELFDATLEEAERAR